MAASPCSFSRKAWLVAPAPAVVQAQALGATQVGVMLLEQDFTKKAQVYPTHECDLRQRCT